MDGQEGRLTIPCTCYNPEPKRAKMTEYQAIITALIAMDVIMALGFFTAWRDTRQLKNSYENYAKTN